MDPNEGSVESGSLAARGQPGTEWTEIVDCLTEVITTSSAKPKGANRVLGGTRC